MKPYRILFVCMGNICRSPTAQGVFEAALAQRGLEAHFEIDSAGTHDYHIGTAPDARAREAALRRGIDISGLRGRQVDASDFERFDMILAMDRDNLQLLEAQCPPQHRHKLSLLLSHSETTRDEEVPDPYYGGRDGFERVLDLIEDASQALLEKLPAGR